MSDDVIPESLDMIALKYGIYCEDMSGARGKTAKFWMIYCHLVDLYLLFHGAMKTCDVDLFTYVVRCAIWYHLYNFKNVKNTHAGVLILVKLQAS